VERWPIDRLIPCAKNRTHSEAQIADGPPARVIACRRGSVGGTLIAVGGGAFLVPDRLAGISEVVRVPHGDCANGDCANAVGAATAQISGETDQVYRDLSRADAITAAEAQAIARATEAGARAEKPGNRYCLVA